jgi:pilus assembly protein Flp/PilA
MVKCGSRRRRFPHKQKGASGIEYALIAVMVALVLVAVSPQVRDAIGGIFTDIATALQGVTTT